MYTPGLNLLLWKSWPVVQIGLVTVVPYSFQPVLSKKPLGKKPTEVDTKAPDVRVREHAAMRFR